MTNNKVVIFCVTALIIHINMVYMNYRCLPSGLKHFSGTSCDKLGVSSDPNDKTVLKQPARSTPPFHKFPLHWAINSLVSSRDASRLRCCSFLLNPEPAEGDFWNNFWNGRVWLNWGMMSCVPSVDGQAFVAQDVWSDGAETGSEGCRNATTRVSPHIILMIFMINDKITEGLYRGNVLLLNIKKGLIYFYYLSS